MSMDRTHSNFTSISMSDALPAAAAAHAGDYETKTNRLTEK